MTGRSLHSKKNLFNQFQRRYHWRYQSLDQAGVIQLLELQAEWLDLQPKLDQPLGLEEQAMREVLENFSALQLTGGAIWIGSQIEAWAVGEVLNHNTAVIHIEKANTTFTGIYAAINQQFAAHQWADIELINREEDMGLAGLRQAKLSYRPLRLVEKFNLNFKI